MKMYNQRRKAQGKPPVRYNPRTGRKAQEDPLTSIVEWTDGALSKVNKEVTDLVPFVGTLEKFEERHKEAVGAAGGILATLFAAETPLGPALVAGPEAGGAIAALSL